MRKRALSVILSVSFVLVSLSGCGNKQSQTGSSTTVAESQVSVETESPVSSESTGTETEAAVETEPVVEVVIDETGLPDDVSSLVYSETPDSLAVSLMMTGDSTEAYDIDGLYSIRKYNEDHCFWCDIPEINTENQSFGNYILDSENRVDTDIDLASRYGSLSPGIYRFCSSIRSQNNDKEYTYGETFMLLENVDSGEVLPEYTYPGDDPLEEVICDYFTKEASYDVSGNAIDIVSPVIFKIEEKEQNETLVWGTFWNTILKKQGNVLYNTAGGENTGLLHIFKTGGHYEITTFDAVQDGSDYDSSWRNICGDDDDVYLMLSAEPTREKLDEKTEELIKEYISKNDLPVTTLYYTGQEPIVLK